tara:strand:- start:365 stop:580 length:216 start_codon:yes stop_codon:yes gene_type:complete
MKKCKSVSRSGMCKEVQIYVDKRLELLSLLHASDGTKSKHDPGDKLSSLVGELLKEIEKVAPNYYKQIKID